MALSHCRFCELASMGRSSLRYQRRSGRDDALKARLNVLASTNACYGYLLLHGLLESERLVVNKKRTYRLYCEEGLQMRTRRRKKLQRPCLSIKVPTVPNQRWSMDFVADQLDNGRRFRILNIVDDFSRALVG